MFNRDDLEFNKTTHTYKLKGKEVPSVSRLIKNFYDPFDAETIAKRMEVQGKGNKDELLQAWKKKADSSIQKGNTIHDTAEVIINAYQKYSQHTIHLLNFLFDFLRSEPEILGTEIMVANEELQYAGTIDLLAAIDGVIIMIDYKTNNDLFKNYKGKTLKSPFADFLDSPFSHYVLQQNHYALCLEEYGIEVERMNLVWLKDFEYEIVTVPDIRNRLKEYYGLN